MRTLQSALFVLLVCFLLLSSPSSIHGQDRNIEVRPASGPRLALVIGNSAYRLGRLRNPVNDARAMVRTLDSLGFDVIHVEDGSLRDMEQAVRNFGRRLREGGTGLFYYAGHGIQVDGENYLIPVDAEMANEGELRYEGVPLGLILAQMEAAENRLNIVLLDACRNNPFSRTWRSASRGLAVVSAPTGTFVSYATRPGDVASDGSGQHSPYTEQVLRFMRVPGLVIEDVFKQVGAAVLDATDGAQTPWYESSLTGNFYFVSGPSSDASQLERPPRQESQPIALPEVRDFQYGARVLRLFRDLPAVGTLQLGRPMQGSLRAGEPFQVWTVDGDAGEYLAVELRTDAFDAAVMFVAPSLAQTGSGVGGSRHNAQLCVALPQTGTYRIVVFSENESNTGPYYVEVRRIPPLGEPGFPCDATQFLSELSIEALSSHGRTLQLGDRARSHLGPGDVMGFGRGYVEAWDLHAQAGQSITVEMIATSFDPALYLHGPGSSPRIVNSSGCLERLTFVPPETGTYRLVALSAWAGSVSSGPYEMRVVRRPSTPPCE